jgi:phenylpropionate dioxygenase-like ring-hydroxylating dioxygenase large terminal subunit
MGELLRRYWQPVWTSDELRDLPKKVRLLCEELVVFRDKKGRVGALEPHCWYFPRVGEGRGGGAALLLSRMAL